MYEVNDNIPIDVENKFSKYIFSWWLLLWLHLESTEIIRTTFHSPTIQREVLP
jgi:hypothetical protein